MSNDVRKYRNEYEREKYFKPTLRIPKEKKSAIEAVSLKMGKSINQLFVEAFEQQYHINLSKDLNYERYISKKLKILSELGYENITELKEVLYSAANDSDTDKIEKIDIAYSSIINSNFKK